jgi:hypothetical protein
MSMVSDARIPVVFGSAQDAAPGDTLFIEGEVFVLSKMGSHPIGCACCLPRGPVAEAFSRLFLARARGEIPYFSRVLAVAATNKGHAAILAALSEDPVISGRFRLG